MKNLLILLLFTILPIGLNAEQNTVTDNPNPVTTEVKEKTPPPPSIRVLRALGYYTVIDSGKKKIYFDAGLNKDITKGLKINIYRTKQMLHPLTGKQYIKKEIIGTGKITFVDDNFSKAKIITKKNKIRKGDLVKVIYPDKMEKSIYLGNSIEYSLTHVDMINLSKYDIHSFRVLFNTSGNTYFGIGIDYLYQYPLIGTDNNKSYLTYYTVGYNSGHFAVYFSPVLGLAENDTVKGLELKMVFGNSVGTHLALLSNNISSIGYKQEIEGTFGLSKNILITSRTNISSFPDSSRSKISSLLEFSLLYNNLLFNLGTGYGGISSQQGGLIGKLMIKYYLK